MEFEVGKTYNITHSRKGNFVVHVIAMDDTWIHSNIVDGKAKMLALANDDVGPGEALTFRASLASINHEVVATNV